MEAMVAVAVVVVQVVVVVVGIIMVLMEVVVTLEKEVLVQIIQVLVVLVIVIAKEIYLADLVVDLVDRDRVALVGQEQVVDFLVVVQVLAVAMPKVVVVVPTIQAKIKKISPLKMKATVW